MWIKNRVSPHLGIVLIKYLNKHYEAIRTGRGEPVAWPTWSPDLIPLDFFLCDCIKSRMNHNGKPETRQQLVECIIGVAAGIRNEMEYIQWELSMEQCLAACTESEGGHLKKKISCTYF
jgi:hypothetical protein